MNADPLGGEGFYLIWESAYWKDDLLRLAKQLEQRARKRRWPEPSLAKLEQSVMLGFYSIRKLVEANKVSTHIVDSGLSLRAYPWNGREVSFLNWHRLDAYDFDAADSTTRSLTFLCNQIIHSFVFAPIHAESGSLEGLMFNSDRTKHEWLFYMAVSDVANLFRQVGNNYPMSGEWERNPTTGEFKVRVGP